MICRVCGEPPNYTELFCSDGCMEDYYGESNRELYADERHPNDLDDDGDTDPDGDNDS